MLTVGSSAELYNQRAYQQKRFQLVHELLHQTQAEQGVLFRTRDLDATARMPFLVNKSEFELAQQFDVFPGSLTGLQQLIAEGSALNGEFKMLSRAIQDTAGEQRQILEELLQQGLAEISAGRAPGVWNPYQEGFRFVATLEERGIIGFTELFQRIDWERCGRIQIGSPEYYALLAHPVQILTPARS